MDFPVNSFILETTFSKSVPITTSFHVMPDARLIQTNGGDILISIKNQGWKFQCKNQDVKIENSLYFAEKEKVLETTCIVVEGTLKQEINKITWSLEKTN